MSASHTDAWSCHGVPVIVSELGTPAASARSASDTSSRSVRPGASASGESVSRVERISASVRCAVSRIVSTGPVARSGATSSAIAAASAWIAIRVSSWPTTSCSSWAILARSAATADCSTLRRSAASSRVSCASRAFCSRCGSQLFCELDEHPGIVDVTLAAIEEPLDRRPQMHVFFSDRASWANVGCDGLPRLGGKTGMEPIDDDYAL